MSNFHQTILTPNINVINIICFLPQKFLNQKKKNNELQQQYVVESFIGNLKNFSNM